MCTALGPLLRAVDSKVGRIGQLACWEHNDPLARYAMMADGEQIHSAMYRGSIYDDLIAEQALVNIRQHALESGCLSSAPPLSWIPSSKHRVSRTPAGASARSRRVPNWIVALMAACLESRSAPAKVQ